MNIEHLFPGTELHVYKVTDVITPEQVKLLIKLAEGKLPTGYRQNELNQAIADIQAASIEACETIFGQNGLVASEENKRWPWFDLSVGESRGFDHSGLFEDETGIVAYLTEFVIQPSTGGGEIEFKQRLLPPNSEKKLIKLAPGEMLLASRGTSHEFAITEITEGVRFTLLTHISK